MNRLSLDGTWDFQVSSGAYKDLSAAQNWRQAVVPMPWQAQFDDLRQVSGTAWYRRQFSANPALAELQGDTAAVLHFGAVDYHATVWLNGTCIGEHEGGYLPFEFDVFNLLREGDNELMLRVVDPTDDPVPGAAFVFSEIPHGKQSWYGPLSGIWQSVWLEYRPKLHIAHLALDPKAGEAALGVQVVLSGPAAGDWRIECTLRDPQGSAAGKGTLDAHQGGLIHLGGDVQLWSPETPNLYTVTAELYVNGSLVHTVEKTTGFRTIEARDGRIYLNGAPVYLRGVLDQGYYPETIYTPPSLAFLEDQARKAKALGFNCLRIHIKVEDPRYYEAADRLGLLVWTEIPNWALLNDASIRRGRETFKGMLERDGHHPSIIAWTLINENWGTDLTRNSEHRAWLAAFYHEMKKLDPTRLVIDNSACGGNAHVAGDLEDYHNYRANPDHADEWDAWVAAFAGRGSEAWYPDYLHERRADLPLIVSEFGNWGLPDPAELDEHQAEPWWFETGFEWDGGIVYPHGVANRFEASGLADLFPSYADFARANQEHMARSLQYEITSMRLHDSIGGYIVTEFTDVHWECNGLLTLQRQPKYRLDPLLKNLNQDKVVLLSPVVWSGVPGTSLEVLAAVKDIDGPGAGGKIAWRAGAQSGELALPGGTITVALQAAGMLTVHAQWLGGDGSVWAANEIELTCAAAAPVAKKLRVFENAPLAKTLRGLGYAVSEDGLDAASAADEMVISSTYSQTIEAFIQQGGRVLVLADIDGPQGSGASAVGAHIPVGHIVARAGTTWQGDWANSFAWIKKQGPLGHLPGGPLLEMEYAELMPDAVIVGLPTWVMRSHSWAGLAVGWVQKTVSLLVEMPYGRGQMLVTTFKLNGATLAHNAVAQALFSGIVNMP